MRILPGRFLSPSVIAAVEPSMCDDVEGVDLGFEMRMGGREGGIAWGGDFAAEERKYVDVFFMKEMLGQSGCMAWILRAGFDVSLNRRE